MFSANSSQVSDSKLFVEDVFSTYLYTGTDTSQTITNGIDLAGKGGLVWVKKRSATDSHALVDTVRGGGNVIESDTTSVYAYNANSIPSFTSSGFRTGINYSGIGGTYASWTFREAPKFFDVVTWTGDGTAGRTIAHNLGIAPGMILVKRTDTSGDWRVYHRSRPNEYASLASTDAFYTASANRVFGNGTTVVAPTSTEFTVGDIATINGSGGTYIAYLYAHDATSDGIIQCGSYTGNGSATGPIVTLGWEPQWVMIKDASAATNWVMYDTMRGFTDGGVDATLFPNLSSEEDGTNTNLLRPLATGFQLTSTSGTRNSSGDTYIYMAIRRGPMRTPTLGTSVFSPQIWTGNGTQRTITAGGIPPDLFISGQRTSPFPDGSSWWNKLAGQSRYLVSSSTGADQPTSDSLNTSSNAFLQDGIALGVNSSQSNTNYATLSTYVGWFLRRAPGFMDVVCYTGTGVARTVNHNLGVVPELIIVKGRSAVTNWPVYFNMQPSSYNRIISLSGTEPASSWNYAAGAGLSGQPTSTVMNFDSGGPANNSGVTYVNYLFASCPGVSKVGSYTGNGSSQTINCAFAAGARFVMIKRTDTFGDWYVWDSARGIVAGNDPHLSLNSVVVEVTTDDSVDTDSSGFVVNQVAATNVNVNAATYIYLAIA